MWQIKRLKQIRVNSNIFTIKWDDTLHGGGFDYKDKTIWIGTINKNRVLEILCHELFEIVTIEMNIRFHRPDCPQDHIFMYDHRQHDTTMCIFAGLLGQFL